jgi:hypothetical protein
MIPADVIGIIIPKFMCFAAQLSGEVNTKSCEKTTYKARTYVGWIMAKNCSKYAGR